MAIKDLWKTYTAGLRTRLIWYVRILPLVVSVMAWLLAHDNSRRVDAICTHAFAGACDDRE